MAVVTSAWATLRFRRSKDVKGWALLGIPQGLYPEVMQPLFERQTRFIEKHGRGEFVNVLFEAPVALAARLALAFPAPPSCEPLVVNQAGNRLLYGKFAQSVKARRQAMESDAWPGLKLLHGDESFWQVVTTLSNVTTLPLDRLHVPGESIAAQAATGRGGRIAEGGSTNSMEQSPAAKTALDSLVQGGLKLQPAAALTRQPKLDNAVSAKLVGGAANLDEEGFEEDDWEDDEIESSEEEVFEDIWDTDESADFWDEPVTHPSKTCVAVDAKSSSNSQSHDSSLSLDKPVKPITRGKNSLASPGGSAIAAQVSTGAAPSLKSSSPPVKPSPQLPARTSQSISPAQFRVQTQPKLRQSETPLPQASPSATHSSRVALPSAASASTSRRGVCEESGTANEYCASDSGAQANQPEAITSANQTQTLGRYRSGLVPHPSDASSLQVYNSGGLTVADAIARSRQQEEEQTAIAEQAQHRRIKLPFERSPTVSSRGNPSQQETRPKPSWFYASPVPQLPEESWAAEAMAAQFVAPAVEPVWDNHHSRLASESWGECSNWDASAGLPMLHNPWLPPGQQPPLAAEPRYWSVDDGEGDGEAVYAEFADWGYYDERGHWVACDPVGAEPLSGSTVETAGALLPVSTDLVCTPVGEEDHGHILLQGVEVWNEWRLANPHIRPNLRGAYLNNLDLAGADLHDVDLSFALLFRADLRSADLSLAVLQGTDLIRADLGGASLWGASLLGAYLSHANLAGADLTQADLQGVYWQGAILAGTVMPDGQLFEEQY